MLPGSIEREIAFVAKDEKPLILLRANWRIGRSFDSLARQRILKFKTEKPDDISGIALGIPSDLS